MSVLRNNQKRVQNGERFPCDTDALRKFLPAGTNIFSVQYYGSSAWSLTARVITSEGLGKDCFLKVAYGQSGRIMLSGEYESSKLIYKKQPDFIPEPLGFGKYWDVSPPETCFYLSRFVDMDVVAKPDPLEFTARLAEMHRLSQSPTGRFGFHVPTCDGDRPHVVDWEESWATFYKKLLLGVCKLDIVANGPWPEFERALDQITSKVIPRLLDPLQSDGRVLKPCLVHGDLWEGNMGINLKTGRSLLFDAGSYFAHNEMELGHWRCEFSSVFRDNVYTKEYLKNYPPADPIEEFDDRNRLYSLKGRLNYSAGHPKSPLRISAYNDMCYLCEKYAPIDMIDKYDPRIDPSLTGATIVPHSEGCFFETQNETQKVKRDSS
ncbi:Fructosamine kinase-domain-containing protein [Xylariaceae sp. FL1272]|nr:Fructosamine kinase-domain-containing protein [Xylariaceae sp. FL1272]